ncbi:MAG: hypothetical protein Q4G25_10980 [Paracoccus sp. (in: a-proteobacteria)]|nr:hypothetical protein [Paracoccus sp. (in: a-proteobacteria)]
MTQMPPRSGTPAETPSPLSFIGAVLYGMFLGLLPAGFAMLWLRMGFAQAAGIAGFLLAFGLLYHVLGWTVVMAPFYALRWIWRQVRGYQPPPAPAPPPERIHWILIAGFFSGMALMILLSIRHSI